LEVNNKTGVWKYAEIPVKIKVGLNDDGYGLDTLSIGGHASIMEEAEVTDKEYLKPDGIESKKWVNDADPDSFFVSTRNETGELVPFIPGSSIRGALRHALSSLLRKEGKKIIDVVYDEEEREDYKHPINRLFGYVDKDGKNAKDGALIIQDAYLADDNDYKMMIIENHAEDEFTQGVYGSGKFNKAIMVKGEFEFKMRIEVYKKDKDIDKTLKEYIELLRKALRLANIGHLDLGGSVYKGSGWVKWSFGEDSIKRNYGSDEKSSLDLLGGKSDGK
jgi:CRISPR/Cas system CSM-associated protein Csm3 (group 7 of RAMP superfamily)